MEANLRNLFVEEENMKDTICSIHGTMTTLALLLRKSSEGGGFFFNTEAGSFY
jgi:hypothetical protein